MDSGDRRAIEKVLRYSEHCRLLLQTIDDVLEDEHRRRAGWRLHYAVDFSEIYSFVLPWESHETAPFADGWAGDPFRQYVTLSLLFDQQGIILPEPYALELRAFGSRVVSQSLVVSLQAMADAYEMLATALQSREADHIALLAQKSRDRALTKEETERVIRFFENNATDLAALARGADLGPLDRLRRLIHQRPFVSLENVTGTPNTVNEGAVHDHFAELTRRRGSTSEGTSYIDALAIEQIFETNRHLARKQERVLLVSRSPHMASVVSAAAANDGTVSFVRHPRIFSAMNRPQEGMTDEFIHNFRQRRDSLSLFIAAATALTERRDSNRALDRVQAMVMDIQNQWNAGESLASALAIAGEDEREQRAATMLRFLRDDSALVQAARDRILEIIEQADRSHLLLGVELQSSHNLEVRTIPYAAELESPRLAQCIRDLADRSTVPVAEALSLFRTAAADAVSHYDFLVGAAISLGTMERWPLAVRYADLAITEAVHHNALPYEARFFRAVFLRELARLKSNRDEARDLLRDALSSLDAAAAEHSLTQPEPDPRHARERALLSTSTTDSASSS